MKNTFVRTMLVLVFLALVANVVITAVKGQSIIDMDMVKIAAFGAIVVANLSIAGAAIYFLSKAEQKNERSSRKWSRRGFVANIAFTLILGAGPWFFYRGAESLSEGVRDCGFVLLLFGATNALFTLAAYRDYVRSVGDHSASSENRRRRKSARRKKSQTAEATWDD